MLLLACAQHRFNIRIDLRNAIGERKRNKCLGKIGVKHGSNNYARPLSCLTSLASSRTKSVAQQGPIFAMWAQYLFDRLGFTVSLIATPNELVLSYSATHY